MNERAPSRDEVFLQTFDWREGRDKKGRIESRSQPSDKGQAEKREKKPALGKEVKVKRQPGEVTDYREADYVRQENGCGQGDKSD